MVYFFQLPCKMAQQSVNLVMNEEEIQQCLIQISRFRFSLVISGLTKILQRTNENVSLFHSMRLVYLL